MKYLVSLSIRPDATPAEVEDVRAPSSQALWALHRKGVVREMYARQDNQGVVFVAEAPDAQSLAQELAALPFLETGLLLGEAVALLPFADLELAFR